MIEDVPAALGMPLNEVDTPSLLIDLDAFERNLRRMAEAAQHAGVALRPHAKTHNHLPLLCGKLSWARSASIARKSVKRRRWCRAVCRMY